MKKLGWVLISLMWKKFGCEWALYNGWREVGELEFENFNAASAKVVVKGQRASGICQE